MSFSRLVTRATIFLGHHDKYVNKGVKERLGDDVIEVKGGLRRGSEGDWAQG